MRPFAPALLGLLVVVSLGTQRAVHSPDALAAGVSQVPATVPNIQGNWRIVDTVQYGLGTDQQFAFGITLRQRGQQVVGLGDGLTLQGRIDGTVLTATYTEDNGSSGTFTWLIGLTHPVLRGTFDNSSGNGGSSVGLPDFNLPGQLPGADGRPAVLVGVVVGLTAIGRAFLPPNLPVILMYIDAATGTVSAIDSAVTSAEGTFTFTETPQPGAYYVSLGVTSAPNNPGAPCSDGPLMPLVPGQNYVILRCSR